jgi:microcystin-dependent protein
MPSPVRALDRRTMRAQFPLSPDRLHNALPLAEPGGLTRRIFAVIAGSRAERCIHPGIRGYPMEVFLGTIQAFGFNFAPRGWANCNGQIMSLAQNSALFSLLGTTYGGNGQTTFALPDLRGRAGLNMGQGPGLSMYDIGQLSGTENATLTISNMPAHNHPATATVGVQVAGTASNPKNAPSASNTYLGAGGTGPSSATIWSDALNDPFAMGGASGSVTVGMAGASTPFSLLNPYLVLNFCIALEGIFPSRN